jgi:DNA-binding transcriptional regulator YiaG
MIRREWIRSQSAIPFQQFAALLGISVSTLRNWEQGRRVPEGPARVLLQVTAKHPEAVLDVVQTMATYSQFKILLSMQSRNVP